MWDQRLMTMWMEQLLKGKVNGCELMLLVIPEYSENAHYTTDFMVNICHTRVEVSLVDVVFACQRYVSQLTSDRLLKIP